MPGRYLLVLYRGKYRCEYGIIWLESKMRQRSNPVRGLCVLKIQTCCFFFIRHPSLKMQLGSLRGRFRFTTTKLQLGGGERVEEWCWMLINSVCLWLTLGRVISCLMYFHSLICSFIYLCWYLRWHRPKPQGRFSVRFRETLHFSTMDSKRLR